MGDVGPDAQRSLVDLLKEHMSIMNLVRDRGHEEYLRVCDGGEKGRVTLLWEPPQWTPEPGDER